MLRYYFVTVWSDMDANEKPKCLNATKDFHPNRFSEIVTAFVPKVLRTRVVRPTCPTCPTRPGKHFCPLKPLILQNVGFHGCLSEETLIN